jgi:predicted nucleotide-binding protein
MTILLVEDDQFYAQRVRELLSDNGIDSIIASTVEEALRNSTPFDGLIVDVMLPNNSQVSGVSEAESRGGFASGIALYRKIRERGFKGPAVFLSSSGHHSDAAVWAKKQGIPFAAKEEGPSSTLAALRKAGIMPKSSGPKAFIVHGQDEATLGQLKDYLQNTLHWPEPIVLREQVSNGKTIIDKFEDFAGRIDCVFVLMTPDDSAVIPLTDADKRRARQNVIFELGFFYAQMGRQTGRVIVLRKGEVELPSDIQGIVWVDISNGIKAAGEEIRREVAHV